MEEAKNICKHCGGRMVVEFIGNYGSIYPMLKNGKPGRRRIRRVLYEESGSDMMVYCSKCGREREER